MFKRNAYKQLLSLPNKNLNLYSSFSLKRFSMLLHEYQAQGLLKKYDVPIPKVIISSSIGSCYSIVKRC